MRALPSNTAKGFHPLEPDCAGAILAPAETKAKYFGKNTACGRGNDVSQSTSGIVFYSIFAPANAYHAFAIMGQGQNALVGLGAKPQGLRGRVPKVLGAESPRSFLFYPSSFTSTAFCACSRFSASSKISSACSSNTSFVISCSRYAGRQCNTIASAFASFISSLFT